MPMVKVGTSYDLRKNRKQERNQKITNVVFWLLFGSLASYGLLDLVFRANGF